MQLNVDGLAVHAATGGRPFDRARPAVIFLHGAGMESCYWQLQSRWFAWHGWSVLCVDLPGHGRSTGAPLTSLAEMAAWVERLMAAAGIDKAALVGHSMGGSIALEAAARLGSRATHLALLGTAGAIPVNDVLLGAAATNPPAAYEMMTARGHGSAAKMGGNRVPGLWLTGAARALLSRNAAGVLHTDLKACADWSTGPAAAAKVACPSLIVIGDQDMMTPPAKARALAELVPGCRTVTIRNCGHMMLQEAPDACLDALVAHLGRAS